MGIQPLTPETSDLKGPTFVTDRGVANGSFKRVGNQNRHLSATEIYNIGTRWQIVNIDMQPVVDMDLDDLDNDIANDLFKATVASDSKALANTDTYAEKLRRLNITTKDGAVTLAGALTLGVYPQQFFPQLVIDVSVHPMRDKSASGTTRFVDRKVCDGPIPTMVEDAVDRVLSNLKMRRVVKGSAGHDIPEIPTEVIPEAITKAVMHRDYHPMMQGESVTVDIYPDRVEVRNPGGLYGDRTVDNIGDGISRSRNAALSNLLRRTPSPVSRGTIAEVAGSGIPRMLSAMRERGLPAPQFEAGPDFVKVTMARHGLLEPDTFNWLDQLPDKKYRTEPENMVLALLLRETQAHVSDIRQTLGYDSDDTRHILGNLLADGLITGDGDGPFQIKDAHRPQQLNQGLVNDELTEVETEEIPGSLPSFIPIKVVRCATHAQSLDPRPSHPTIGSSALAPYRTTEVARSHHRTSEIEIRHLTRRLT